VDKKIFRHLLYHAYVLNLIIFYFHDIYTNYVMESLNIFDIKASLASRSRVPGFSSPCENLVRLFFHRSQSHFGHSLGLTSLSVCFCCQINITMRCSMLSFCGKDKYRNNLHIFKQTPHSGYVTLCYFNHCQHKNHVTMVYHVIDSKLKPLFTAHTVSQ